jgi:hypothetical protein
VKASATNKLFSVFAATCDDGIISAFCARLGVCLLSPALSSKGGEGEEPPLRILWRPLRLDKEDAARSNRRRERTLARAFARTEKTQNQL